MRQKIWNDLEFLQGFADFTSFPSIRVSDFPLRLNSSFLGYRAPFPSFDAQYCITDVSCKMEKEFLVRPSTWHS